MRITDEQLQTIRERAEKCAELIELMNLTFTKYPKENTIMAITACIVDTLNPANRP